MPYAWGGTDSPVQSTTKGFAMETLVTILGWISGLFGIGLLLSTPGCMGCKIAGCVAIISGLIALNTHSIAPLLVGFGILWLLRIMGFEP